jgi:hypothetical protein
MTIANVPEATPRRNSNPTRPAGYWARRREFWLRESERLGTDWPGFWQFLDQLLALEARS